MPLLWPDISVGLLEYKVAAAHISTHAHFVESLCYFGGLDEDYYTSIVYPRLRTLQLPEIIMFQSEISRAGPYPLYFPNSRGRTSSSIEGLQVSADISLSHPMTQFARLNPTVRKLTCGLRHKESRMFWEVVETDWKELEEVTVSGGVDEDVVETFWRVCSDRVRSLYLTPDGFSEDGLGIISTLSFERLERLALVRNLRWTEPYHSATWPLVLLEQVKKTSRGLRRLHWGMRNIPLPVRVVLDALAEECWPELCEVIIEDGVSSEEEVVKVLSALPSRRLKVLGFKGCEDAGEFGGPLIDCLRGREYFSQLRELNVWRCKGVTSTMVQEILTNCVHLISLDARYIFVRDIATASKGWGCFKLERLVVRIVKLERDEAGWEERVFNQVSKLRRLKVLDLEHYHTQEHDLIMALKTLDYRLSISPVGSKRSGKTGSGESDGGERNHDIRCWSSLIQLRDFSFDGKRQRLGMDEALWMMDHWQDMVVVRGYFSGVEGDDADRIKQLFSEKGIESGGLLYYV